MLASAFAIEQSHHLVLAEIRAVELTPDEARELVNELTEHMRYDNAQYFVLDMRTVSYIPSASLAILVGFVQDLEHVRGRVALANCQPAVASVFKVTRLDVLFELCEDELPSFQQARA